MDKLLSAFTYLVLLNLSLTIITVYIDMIIKLIINKSPILFVQYWNTEAYTIIYI